MTTTKSSFRDSRFWALYRSSLKGQVAFMIIAAILFVILIPLVFYTTFRPYSRYNFGTGVQEYYATLGYFQNGIYIFDAYAAFVLVALIVLAIILALIQNAYLHNKKMTDLYHGIPVRRTQLLGANLLAGMTTILGPFLAVYMMTMVSQLILFGRWIAPMQYFRYIAIDLACAILAVAVAYIFTSLIAVNVGTVFDSFAITGLVGVMPLVLWSAVALLGEAMINGVESHYNYVLLLSPFTFAFQRFLNINYTMENNGDYSGYLATLGNLAVWLVIGVGLFCLAAWCYHRRKNELAEQPRPTGALQLLSKCFGAFCGGLLFFGIFYQTGIIGWIPAVLAGALLIGTIGELILSRGARTLLKNMKWLFGAGCLCLVLVLGARFDILRIGASVPNPSAVRSVTLNYSGRFAGLGDNLNGTPTLTDPDSIALVTELHRSIVAPDELHEAFLWLRLEYQLANGRTLARRYGDMTKTALEKIVQLETTEAYVRQNHLLFQIEDRDASLQEITTYDAYGENARSKTLTREEGERLIEAARIDLLSDTPETLTFAARGYVTFHFNVAEDRQSIPRGCTVIVSEHYTHTTAVLEELGLLAGMKPTASVDYAVLLPWSYTGYYPQGLFTFVTPGDHDVFAYGDIEDRVNTSDKGEIQQLLRGGRNQVLTRTTDSYYPDLDLVAVGLYSDNRYVGTQLIHWENLPERLLQELISLYAYDEYAVAITEDVAFAEVEILAEEIRSSY